MDCAASGSELFYGLITFDDPVLCTRDVLGSVQAISIGGVEGEIELPGPYVAPETGIEDDARPVAPKDALTWKRGNEPLFWGRIIRWPHGWAAVHSALMRFRLPADRMHDKATAVHHNFLGWFDAFVAYVDLLTKQRRTAFSEVEPYPSQLDLFRWVAEGSRDRPYKAAPQAVSLQLVMTDETLLTPKQFREACELASSGRPPALHYRVQLEAYRAMRARDFRKALIETGSAAELALTRVIRDRLERLGVTFADELSKKYQGLGGKFQMARTVGLQMPDLDYRKRLVQPRNDVTHKGGFGDRETAFDAIKVTDQLLAAICPSLQEQ